MRVSEPGRDRRIIVSSGDRTIREIKCRRVNPAEMQRISVKAGSLAGLERIEVSVDG
jgi:hypothetical protein